MGVWDAYNARLSARGKNRREVTLNRERDYLARKLPDSLSYHTVLMNGQEQNLAVINSDNLDQKTLCSMPGEKIVGGSLVKWADNHWLVTAVDANQEVYARATMVQCNHKLRWVADDGNIIERWCIVSDGTKYLTGETMSSTRAHVLCKEFEKIIH